MDKPNKPPQPLDIIFLSFRIGFRRMAVWIRPNLWMALLSLAVVTIPAAQAGLYQAVRAGLLDPGDSRSNVQQEFKAGFFRHFGYSLVLGITNLAVLGVIVFSALFWTRQEERVFNYLSIISFYFLLMWWLCQPFLYPLMIEHPGVAIPRLARMALALVVRHPFYALVITLTNTLLTLIGAVLLGPILFIIPALVALISIQSYWHLTGQGIPEWVDPIIYENKLAMAEKRPQDPADAGNQRRKHEF